VLLGGRAAEQLIFGEVSTGAADDLTKVTDIARSMVARYGMHADLGNIVFDPPRRAFLEVPGLEPSPRSYSEDTARAIDKAVRQLVDAAFAQSLGLLHARRATLETGARRLLEKETLTDVDLQQLLREAEASGASAASDDPVAAGSVESRRGEPATASGPSGTAGQAAAG